MLRDETQEGERLRGGRDRVSNRTLRILLDLFLVVMLLTDVVTLLCIDLRECTVSDKEKERKRGVFQKARKHHLNFHHNITLQK